MRKVRVIEVTTEGGHKAAKFTTAREIEILANGILLIEGCAYSSRRLAKHLDGILERVAAVLDETAQRLESDPRLCQTVAWRAAQNRREVLRRINRLYTEILDNGYGHAAASRVVDPLRRQAEEWFQRFDQPGLVD